MSAMRPDAEQRFIERVRRRILGLESEVLRGLVRGYSVLEESLSPTELARILASDRVDDLFSGPLSRASIDRAFTPLRLRIRTVFERGYSLATHDLPSRRGLPRLATSVDVLEPRVIQSLRSLTDDVIAQLEADLRASVRQAADAAIAAKLSTRATVTAVRDAVKLPPPGELAVRNFRAALERGDVSKALSYKLRDERHDARIKRLSDPAKPRLTTKQVDTMVESYKRGVEAHHASVTSRTATFDTYKRSQVETWKQAIENGIVDGDGLRRRWITMEDARVRPTHRVMHGQTVRIDQPYSTGQMTAGDGEYGCRCIDRFVEV